jgi:hypothetical protein
MVDVKISVRGQNALVSPPQGVIASGSLVVFNDDIVSFQLVEGSSSFLLEIELRESDVNRGVGMTSTRTSTSTKITLMNFNEPGGVAIRTRLERLGSLAILCPDDICQIK